MDAHYARFVSAAMANKKLRGRIGSVQGAPSERTYVPGAELWTDVQPEIDPVVGVVLEMDRTPTVELGTDPCATLVIEVSRDGGATWQHLHSADIASGKVLKDGNRATTSAISVIGWGDGPVPTHTRCGIRAQKNMRTTTRIRPLLLDVTPLPLG